MSPPTCTPADSQTALKYGALNTVPVIHLLQITDNDTLTQIVHSAPDHLRHHLPANPSSHELLAEVLRLRESETKTRKAPEDILRSLLALSPSDVLDRADKEPAHLRDEMKQALLADPTLVPHDIPDDNPSRLAAVLSAWKIHALTGAKATSSSSGTPQRKASDETPTPQRNELTFSPALPKPRPRSLNSEASSEAARPAKKTKAPIAPKNFSFGRTSATADALTHYPGKGVSSTSLAVEEMLGPMILSLLIRGGNDVLTYLNRDFHHFHAKLPLGPHPQQRSRR